jgi:hypothetical protein
MTEIKEGYKISLMTLKIFNTEHEQNMKQLAKDMTKLNFIKTSESSNFEKEMQKIQNHDLLYVLTVPLILWFMAFLSSFTIPKTLFASFELRASVIFLFLDSRTYKGLPEFAQGEIKISTIESFYGKLHNAGSRKIEFEVMEKYVTSLPTVCQLLHILLMFCIKYF